jgi:hypothetical protein
MPVGIKGPRCKWVPVGRIQTGPQGRISIDPNAETLDRGPLSLELKFSGFRDRVGTRDRLVGRSAHEDLSTGGGRLEASGRIRNVTNGGGVLEAAATDVADVLLPGADPGSARSVGLRRGGPGSE